MDCLFNIICPIFVKFLCGSDRQNLSFVNQHLRWLVKREHKHLLLIEYMRLVDILTDVDAVLVNRIKNDALRTWNIQDDNIDSYFSLLCATIKMLPKRSYFQLLLLLLEEVDDALNTFQQLLYHMNYSEKNLLAIVKVAHEITKSQKLKQFCRTQNQVTYSSFFSLLPQQIQKVGIKKSEPFVKFVNQNSQKLKEPYSSFFIITNSLLKDHSYHLTQRELDATKDFVGFFHKDIVSYNNKQFRSQLRFKHKRNIFNLVPHHIMQKFSRSYGNEIHCDVVRNCLDFFDGHTIAKRSRYVINHRYHSEIFNHLIFPIPEMMERLYMGPKRYPLGYRDSECIYQILSPSRLPFYQENKVVISCKTLFELANQSFTDYQKAIQMMNSDIFKQLRGQYNLDTTTLLDMLNVNDILDWSKILVLLQHSNKYHKILKRFDKYGFESETKFRKSWFSMTSTQMQSFQF